MWNSIKSLISNYYIVFKGPIKAASWIAIAGGLAICCLFIIIANQVLPKSANYPEVWTYNWFMIQFGTLAKLLLVGASTAFFTKLAGGMGMYQDAIASVLGNDAWLDRRNDLPELWKRVTRRVFMPGFHQSDANSAELLSHVNSSLTRLLFQDGRIVEYYAINVRRRLTISWEDEAKELIRIDDFVESDVVPYKTAGKFIYKIDFWPSPSVEVGKSNLNFVSFKVNGLDRSPDEIKKYDHSTYKIDLDGGKPHKISREIIHTQNLAEDPIFIVVAGRIVWNLSVIVSVKSHNLRVNFYDIGGNDLFSTIGNETNRHFIERECRGVVLPEQGFILSVIKVQQQPV